MVKTTALGQNQGPVRAGVRRLGRGVLGGARHGQGAAVVQGEGGVEVHEAQVILTSGKTSPNCPMFPDFSEVLQFCRIMGTPQKKGDFFFSAGHESNLMAEMGNQRVKRLALGKWDCVVL